MLRPGSAGSSTAADHLRLPGDAITALPPALRRRLMVTCDGAGASHALVAELDRASSWSPPGPSRSSPVSSATWASWTEKMRVFARRERPHPGAQLSLSGAAAAGGTPCGSPACPRRRGAGAASAPASTTPTASAHRVHARVEDVIRTGKDTGLGHFPSHDYKINQAWLDTAMTASILLSWLRLLALDGGLARAEPRTLRYRVLHAAARLVSGGRRKTLKIAATWPWAEEIVTAWQRVQAIPHSP